MRSVHRVVLASTLGVATLATGTLPALAQQPDERAEDISQVIVTGTRVANRSALDTAVPVDVVSSDTLTNGGITELNQALSIALPSLNFPRPGLADGTDTDPPGNAARPVSLTRRWCCSTRSGDIPRRSST